MNLRNLFRYGVLAIALMGIAVAMDHDRNDEKILIIGCKPWDENIKDVQGLEKADFLDFLPHAAPKEGLPSHFHHYDLNDTGLCPVDKYIPGKFSDFAEKNPHKYSTIIIDWATYQHVRRPGAWKDFSLLLSPGGNLVVPINRTVGTLGNACGLYYVSAAEIFISGIPQSRDFKKDKIYLEKKDDRNLKFALIATDGLPAEGEIDFPITGELNDNIVHSGKNDIIQKINKVKINRSQEAAKGIKDVIKSLFHSVKILSYGEIPALECFDILRRDEMKQRFGDFNPAIIFATKKN